MSRVYQRYQELEKIVLDKDAEIAILKARVNQLEQQEHKSSARSSFLINGCGKDDKRLCTPPRIASFSGSKRDKSHQEYLEQRVSELEYLMQHISSLSSQSILGQDGNRFRTLSNQGDSFYSTAVPSLLSTPSIVSYNTQPHFEQQSMSYHLEKLRDIADDGDRKVEMSEKVEDTDGVDEDDDEGEEDAMSMIAAYATRHNIGALSPSAKKPELGEMSEIHDRNQEIETIDNITNQNFESTQRHSLALINSNSDDDSIQEGTLLPLPNEASPLERTPKKEDLSGVTETDFFDLLLRVNQAADSSPHS